MGDNTKKIVLTYRSANVVMIFNEISHARPPVVELVGLCVLYPAAIAKAPLGHDSRNAVHAAEVDLDPFFCSKLTTDGRG